MQHHWLILTLGNHKGIVDVCVVWLLLKLLLVCVDLLSHKVTHDLGIISARGNVLRVKPALFLFLFIHKHLLLLLLIEHLLLLLVHLLLLKNHLLPHKRLLLLLLSVR
jgi:hypothetical protein